MHFKGQENTSVLAYWLSTTSTLLVLVQNTLKASSSPPKVAGYRDRTSPTTLFGRMAQVSSFLFIFLFLSFFFICVSQGKSFSLRNSYSVNHIARVIVHLQWA